MGDRNHAFEMHTEDTLAKLDTDTTILFKIVSDLAAKIRNLESDLDEHKFGDHK